MTTETAESTLVCKYVTRLSRTDTDLLLTLSKATNYTPQQIGRYAIRKYLKEKINENPSLLLEG